MINGNGSSKTIYLEEAPTLVDSLADTIHSQNKAVGWWDGSPCLITKIQLVNTEIAEATEGERKDLMDDHLPHRKMGEVELADAAIRLLDIAGHMNWKYTLDGIYDIVNGMCLERIKAIGARHGILTLMISGLIAPLIEEDDDIADQMADHMEVLYSACLFSICKVARDQGYDIEAAIHEKTAYNKNRLDHKRENRAADNGKKF